MSEELQSQELQEQETQSVESNQEEIKKEASQEESIQAKNFRELRTQAEQLKRERDEALRILQAQQAKKSDSADEDISLNPDDLVEGKHLSKFQKKIKQLEDQLKNYESKSSEMAIESKLKYQYPDFDKVVNEKTVENLRKQYPELASTINTSSDLYSKAVTAYTLIKKLDLIPDQQVEYEQGLAEKNKQKPRSLAAVKQADSPLTRAHAFENGLNDDLRKELWREMQNARKAS